MYTAVEKGSYCLHSITLLYFSFGKTENDYTCQQQRQGWGNQHPLPHLGCVPQQAVRQQGAQSSPAEWQTWIHGTGEPETSQEHHMTLPTKGTAVAETGQSKQTTTLSAFPN